MAKLEKDWQNSNAINLTCPELRHIGQDANSYFGLVHPVNFSPSPPLTTSATDNHATDKWLLNW